MTAPADSREAFVDWYVKNAFDLASEPIGCREFALQWEAWQEALTHQGRVVPVSVLDEVIGEIDRAATNYCAYEYGLPTHDLGFMDKARASIRAIIEKGEM